MNTDSPLVIRGIGAVSAAGWSVADLLDAVIEKRHIPTTLLPRTGSKRDWDCHVRLVPSPPPDRLPKHNRLRRASNVTRFAMAAAVEAMGASASTSTGIIVCMMNGCVSFTNRFYQEVLDDPAMASPILFPETVFNAPASHLASYLGVSGPVSTLIGEPNIIAEALRLAQTWMDLGQVDQCLVIGAEEADWLSTEGVTYYDKRLVVSEGTGALLLAQSGDGPRLQNLAGPFAYHSNLERQTELLQMTSALAPLQADVLIDSALGLARFDRQEQAAWSPHWNGEVLSPRRLLGEGMGSSSALQLVLAAALAQSHQRRTLVSMPGANTAGYGCAVVP